MSVPIKGVGSFTVSMTDISKVDISTLTVDQLQNLLAQKMASQKQPEVTTVPVKEPVKEPVKLCAFRPSRINQEECKSEPVVFYGNNGYCAKHRKTVQAIKARSTVDVDKNNVGKHSDDPKDFGRLSDDPKEVKEEVKESQPSEEDQKNVKTQKVPVKSSGTSIPSKPVENVKPKISSPQKEKPVARPVAKTTQKKIRPNQWGRFEDPDTNIVFEPATKMAYGVQDHISGKVVKLTPKHIEICKRHQWAYGPVAEVVEKCEGCHKALNLCECSDEEEASSEIFDDEDDGDDGDDEEVDDEEDDDDDDEVEEVEEEDDDDDEEVEEEEEDEEVEEEDE
jgi:hypothetical protein